MEEKKEPQAPSIDEAFKSLPPTTTPVSSFLVSRKFRIVLFVVCISIISYAVLTALW